MLVFYKARNEQKILEHFILPDRFQYYPHFTDQLDSSGTILKIDSSNQLFCPYLLISAVDVVVYVPKLICGFCLSFQTQMFTQSFFSFITLTYSYRYVFSFISVDCLLFIYFLCISYSFEESHFHRLYPYYFPLSLYPFLL